MSDYELNLRRQELMEEARRIFFQLDAGVRPPRPVLEALVSSSGVKRVADMPAEVLDMAFAYLEAVCEIYGLPKKPVAVAA